MTQAAVTLATIIDDLPTSFSDVLIKGLSSDSRAIEEGFAFFALAGSKADGAVYIKHAIERGASVVISEAPRPADLPSSVAYLMVSDARLCLAHAAARFYARQPETIVAVTGTAGKSSVADFTRQIFSHAKCRAASLGTIGIVRDTHVTYGALTTPDPVSLHQNLQMLADEGITHLAMEASSHGLDQKRLDGVRIKAAAFTNLGHDHLDYHGTEEAYLNAKLRLFDTLLPHDGVAVINADAPQSKAVAEIAQKRGLALISVGRAGHDIRLNQVTRDGFDQRLDLSIKGRPAQLRLALAGDFQTSNALVAAGLALAVGIDENMMIDALSHLKGVPGRLERVGIKQGGLIVIDYAHKPEALVAALDALRPFVTGRLICVFGCGGDRDTAKRPLMGTLAQDKADDVIVTDDNPRSEDPASIRRAILESCPKAQEIGDRRAAINHALDRMGPGDVVLIAGKGHETGQIIGQTVIPFSDHEVVADNLRKGAA